MHKTMEEIEKICEAKKQLMCWVQEEINCGKEYMSDPIVVQNVGQLVDMVKDFAEAEEKIMKTKYYEMMVCAAMTTGDDMMEVGRMGYDNWRYKSGKFAPKGRGTDVGHGSRLRMGYDKYAPWPDYVHPYMSPETPDYMRWRRPEDRLTSNMMGYPMDEIWEYGQDWSGEKGKRTPYDPYEEYHKAKKHYTTSMDSESHKVMDDRIVEAGVDMISSIGEMWDDASPETRKKLEENMKTLMKQWEKH